MRKRNLIILLAVMMCALFVMFGQVTTAAPYFFESESNDSQSAADGPVNLNTIITGQLSVSYDQDWFRIKCIQNVPITFYLDATAYYLTGYIYDQNGNPIGSQINWHQSNILTPSYTGYIYVKVTTSIYPGINYTLSVTTSMVYESEPNDSLSTADGPVFLNNTMAGQLSVSYDQDWYKIECNQNVPITFYLDASAYYLTGYIYDKNGNSVGNQINWHQSNTFTPSYTGYIYVKVTTSIYPGINYTLIALAN